MDEPLCPTWTEWIRMVQAVIPTHLRANLRNPLKAVKANNAGATQWWCLHRRRGVLQSLIASCHQVSSSLRANCPIGTNSRKLRQRLAMPHTEVSPIWNYLTVLFGLCRVRISRFWWRSMFHQGGSLLKVQGTVDPWGYCRWTVLRTKVEED